jgi:hypothetical protein
MTHLRTKDEYLFANSVPLSEERMQTNQLPYPLHLFTLRLWQEVLNDEQVEWRGEVKNTKTGETRYFRDWQVLAHLLPTMVAEPAARDSLDIS